MMSDLKELELIVLKLLQMCMEVDINKSSLGELEEYLIVVDDLKVKLSSIRAKLFAEIFRRKFASKI